MTIIQFLFRLLERFAITPAEAREIEHEANLWYLDQIERRTMVGKILDDYGNMWYTKLCLAVLFIFANRWIADYMNPNNNRTQEPQY